MKKGILFTKNFYEKYHLKSQNSQEIKNAVYLFEYRLKYANMNFLTYLKFIKKEINSFTPIKIKEYEKVFSTMNELKSLIYSDEEVTMKKAYENKMCKQYILKMKLQNKEIQKLLQLKRKKLIHKYLPEIKALLQKINLYRNRKIKLNEILKGDL